MNDYRYAMMLSLQDELEKKAIGLPAASTVKIGAAMEKTAVSVGPTLGRVGSFLRQQAGAAGAGMGVGALGGGLVGAGVQGVRGYQQAKEQGATGREALLEGAAKGLKGAGTGAAIGAGLGGAAGLAGGSKARELASRAVQGGNPVAAASRFGQRQLHSVTGYANASTPEGLAQLRSMRAGAYGAKGRADAARQVMRNMRQQGNADPKAVRKAALELQKAQRGLRAAETAEGMGLTSLPGYLKSLATNPAATLRAGMAEQWHGSGLTGKAMVTGLPAMSVAGELASSTQEGGPGKMERAGKAALGSLAYGAAPMPIVGMSALAGGASRLGGLLGAGGDTVLARSAQQVAQ